MPNITVLPGTTQTITQSESDNVTFVGAGTLDIAGPAGSPPIDVTLSTVTAGTLADINLSNADVTVAGLGGVSALVAYQVGAAGTLDFGSTAGVAAGTTVTFTAPDSHLVLRNGANVSALGGIFGYGPGSTIDVSGLAASAVYADAPGANTGGTLSLFDASGNPVGSVTLADGNFATNNFKITADGANGTLIRPRGQS